MCFSATPNDYCMYLHYFDMRSYRLFVVIYDTEMTTNDGGALALKVNHIMWIVAYSTM